MYVALFNQCIITVVCLNIVSDLAFNKTTQQSSVHLTKGIYEESSRGVDSSFSTIFQTKKEENPWWTVDLGQVYPVWSVFIVNLGGIYCEY